MAQLELKRAREGVSILTLQFELHDNEVEELLNEGIGYFLGSYDDPDVAFLDRPAHGATVTDMREGADRAEIAGPAEWAFEPVGEAQRVPGMHAADGVPYPWWENVARDRDPRFEPPAVKV